MMMASMRSLAAFALVAGAAAKSSSVRRNQETPTYDLMPFPDDAVSNNIVNGENAGANEFPFYAVFEGGTLCGAALIAEDVLVTAAHCVDGGAPPSVRIGATSSNNGITAQICNSIIHPNYRSAELENDIAILTLCDPVNNAIAAFNADANVPGNNDALVAMGFGRTNANSGGGSNQLLKLDMEYVNDNECANRYGDHNSGFNLCVDNPDGGICFGDSGGPVVNANGLVLGVASFIIQACDSNFPDFYTRMSSYSTWVTRQVCEESGSPPDTLDCAGVGDDDGPGGGGGDDEDSGCFLLDLVLDFFGI